MNIDTLDIFSFAIVDCSIINIKEYLEQQKSYDYRLVYENKDVETFYFNSMYLEPIKGTAKGLFFSPNIAPNLTLVLGNGTGSWGTLCNNLSSNLHIKNTQIMMQNVKLPEKSNRLSIYDSGKTIRTVFGFTGDYNRMEFVNSGNPLPFENVEYYKKRRITDRINKNILIEYAEKIGFDLRNEHCLFSNQKSLYVELDGK